MPRLRQVPPSEAHPNAQKYYRAMFKGGEPSVGTETGTPGDWWTTLALRPYVFDHAVAHLEMYAMLGGESQSKLDPKIRELALTRVGFILGSQFVYSQHCKVSTMVGIEDHKIAAVPHWATLSIWSTLERAILAYTDAVVYDKGRVPDGVFEAVKSQMSDEDIMEMTYHICGYVMHALFTKSLRLEYDNVPERVVEVPMPGGADFKTWAAQKGIGKKPANSSLPSE